jgi:hypothetical protein
MKSTKMSLNSSYMSKAKLNLFGQYVAKGQATLALGKMSAILHWEILAILHIL